MSDDIERMVNRQILMHAVQRKMFCDLTERVLDVRKAVSVTATLDEKAGTSVFCADAYDKMADGLRVAAEKSGATLEILDGRELYGRRKAA